MEKTKVAIIGGGMGGLSAAFRLMEAAPEAYEITVYQRGHLLGGKGASRRDTDAHERIYEHGIHVLMGFYDDVFHVLRTVWEDLRALPRADDPTKSALPGVSPGAEVPWWDGILRPKDDMVLLDPVGDRMSYWHVVFPQRASQIGERGERTMKSILTRIAEELLGLGLGGSAMQLIDGTAAQVSGAVQATQAAVHDVVQEIQAKAGEIQKNVRDFLLKRLGIAFPQGPGAMGFRPDTHFMDALPLAFEQMKTSLSDDPAWHQTFASMVRVALAARWELVRRVDDDEQRRAFYLRYFLGATYIGLVEEGIYDEASLDKLDEHDFRDWLRSHDPLNGDAPPEMTYDTPVVRAVYDLVFTRKSSWAAGRFIHSCLKMGLGYRGHLFYEMTAGMGDVVFAPLYLWLRNKGVKFRFFRDVHKLTWSDDRKLIRGFNFRRQVRPHGADGDSYCPIRYAEDGWPFFPEVAPGAEKSMLLPPSRDFEEDTSHDVVILAVGGGAVAAIGADVPTLAALDLPTTATYSFQVWTDQSLKDLGFPSAEDPIIGAGKDSMAYCDMSVVLDKGAWPEGQRPGHVGYFSDSLTAEEEKAGVDGVRQRARDWLVQQGHILFPKVASPGQFDWSALVAPPDASGEQRLDHQYFTANTDPSDRYTEPKMGSIAGRLAADESGVPNLFLAGDWVRNDVGAGYVQGAAEAGHAAAEAILRTYKSAVSDTGFVVRDNNWVHPPPLLLEGATMCAFAVPCDRTRLEHLCSSLFGAPSGGAVVVTPSAAVAIVTFVDLPKIGSTDPDWADAGSISEKDVAIWLPVTLRYRDSDGNMLDQAAWVIPYIWVDNPASLIEGRELYGFPKALGSIAMEWGRGDLFQGTLRAHVLPTRGAAVSEQEVLRIEGHRYEERIDLPELDELWRKRGDGITVVFLRQAVDVSDPRKAAFQEIVTAQTTVRMVGHRRLPGCYKVKTSDWESVRVREKLGLRPDAQVLGIELKLDMTLGKGNTIWRGV